MNEVIFTAEMKKLAVPIQVGRETWYAFPFFIHEVQINSRVKRYELVRLDDVPEEVRAETSKIKL